MFTALLSLMFTTGCEIASGEPQVSYCDAVCDWATQCAQNERPIDADLDTQCKADTNAVDPSCAIASAGELSLTQSTLLTSCTDAITTAQNNCDSFTGSIDDIKMGTPPTECITQGDGVQETYDEARRSTAETNDQLCDRFTLTFCEQVDSCLVSQLGDIPDTVWEDLGGTAVELCQTSVGVDTFSGSCSNDSLYILESDFTEVNVARQGARECLRDFSSLTCDGLLSGQVPAECAASFTSTKQALAFAEGLVSVADLVEGALQ